MERQLNTVTGRATQKAKERETEVASNTQLDIPGDWNDSANPENVKYPQLDKGKQAYRKPDRQEDQRKDRTPSYSPLNEHLEEPENPKTSPKKDLTSRQKNQLAYSKASYSRDSVLMLTIGGEH